MARRWLSRSGLGATTASLPSSFFCHEDTRPGGGGRSLPPTNRQEQVGRILDQRVGGGYFFIFTMVCWMVRLLVSASLPRACWGTRSTEPCLPTLDQLGGRAARAAGGRRL